MMCRNGCGFYGHPSYDNYCSKCYNTVIKPKLQQQQQQAAAPAASAPISIRPASGAASAAHAHASSAPSASSPSQAVPSIQEPVAGSSPSSAAALSTSPLGASPASGGSPSSPLKNGRVCGHPECKKKLPLTAVACRCGLTFCSTHRYAEAHNCNFDYKTRQQEMLKEANPTVVHSKLESI